MKKIWNTPEVVKLEIVKTEGGSNAMSENNNANPPHGLNIPS